MGQGLTASVVCMSVTPFGMQLIFFFLVKIARGSETRATLHWHRKTGRAQLPGCVGGAGYETKWTYFRTRVAARKLSKPERL